MTELPPVRRPAFTLDAAVDNNVQQGGAAREIRFVDCKAWPSRMSPDGCGIKPQPTTSVFSFPPARRMQARAPETNGSMSGTVRSVGFQYQGNFRASRQNRFRTRLDQLERNFTDDGPRMTGRHAGLDAFATINGLHHARLIRIRRQKHLNAGRLKNIMHDTRLDRPMSGQQTNRFNIRLGAAQVIQRRVQQMDQWQTDLRRDCGQKPCAVTHGMTRKSAPAAVSVAAPRASHGTGLSPPRKRAAVRSGIWGQLQRSVGYMILVHRCRCIAHQQFKEAHRGFRPHAAEDTDRLHARTIPG